MEMRRIFAAVDDTPASLHAAGVAVEIARAVRAQVRFVHALADGEVARTFTDMKRDRTLRQRRASASESLLAHLLDKAQQAGVPADTAYLEGDPATVILAHSASWRADMVVLGRTRRKGAGRSYVGATARHVLEFSEVPVLLVPGAPAAGSAGAVQQL